MRNPLGNPNSWKGKYSFNSTEWNNIDKKLVCKLLNVDEIKSGYFFMEFDDFFDLFDEIYLNYIGFDYIFGHNSKNWHRNLIYGEFLPNVNSGGCYSNLIF